MPRLYSKTKMISFRLSASEYEALKSLHLSRGARNVSELARSAIQRMIVGNPTLGLDDPVQAQLVDLHHRVSSLESMVARLTGTPHQPPAEC